MSTSPSNPDVLDLWLDGLLAGKLMRGQTGNVEFSYHESYLTKQHSTQLSLSMPLSRIHHAPEQVEPWLSNLLPDAPEVRTRWAAKFNETRHDPFTLLRHMGQDAQGSVQVVPEGIEPSQAGTLSEQSPEHIAARVEGIINDPDHWVDDTDEDAGRFSLGGNQGKFALAKVGERWFEPNGRAASTHILKPGMAIASGTTNAEAQAVEFATMRASSFLEIPTAKVEIIDFAGVSAFVTERYDRLTIPDNSTNTLDKTNSPTVSSNSIVRRIHQEDFCQALSILPSQKYEQDGGPTMAEMVALIDSGVTAQYGAGDSLTLARLFVFNLLVAGIDAHAKNHSMLLYGGRVRLAPAYDLISAFGLWDVDRVRYCASAAVKYGKIRRFRSITGRDLMRTADVIGISRSEFLNEMHEMCAHLRESFEQAIADLPPVLLTERVRRMPERIEQFATEIVSRVTANNVSGTPQYQAPVLSRSHLAHTSKVWFPGRWMGGRWETGHYRSRPST